MCNTFAVYFQIFATFGYKKVKNSESFDKAVRMAIIKNIVVDFLKCMFRPLKPVLLHIINVIRR